METLFYKLMYDKQLKRSMTLLDILSKAERAVTIKELEQSLAVSKQTVLSTIEFAKSLLAEDLYLELGKKDVQLFNNSQRPIEVVLTEIARETIPNKVLEHVFYDRDLNIHAMAEALFISESTLRSVIVHMNKTLRLFKCSISFYDLKMLGTETDIRYFFYAYFSEFQDLFHALFEKPLQVCLAIFEDIKRISVTKNGKLLNYSSQQAVRWMILAKERLEVKRCVHIEESLMQRVQSRTSYTGFKHIYENKIMRYLACAQVPEAEIAWAYIVGFNTIIYHNNDGCEWCPDDADSSISEEKVTAAFCSVSHTLRIPQDCRPQFLAIHTAYFLNLSLLTDLSSCFQIGSGSVKNYVIQNLKWPYKIWMDYLSKIYDGHILPIHDIGTIATQLTMISSQFIYSQQVKAERVLYSFEGESGLPAYLEGLARTLLPSGIDGVFIYSEPITAELVRQISPDIVVSNYQINEEFEGCRVLRMSYIPQIQEWTLLREWIVDLGSGDSKNQ